MACNILSSLSDTDYSFGGERRNACAERFSVFTGAKCMLNQSKIRSIFLTTDRDFRAFGIQLLNECGYTGDKVFGFSIQDLDKILKTEKDCGNIVLNGREQVGKELVGYCERMHQLLGLGTTMQVLVMFEPSSQAAFIGDIKDRFFEYNFKPLPIEKKYYLETFYSRNPDYQAFMTKRAKRLAELTGPVKPTAATQTFFEASAHVKETIELINKLASDYGQTKLVLDIGQRFNGFFGAFSFLYGKEGFSELTDLARLIDNIAFTYETSGAMLTEEHFKMLHQAAKGAFLVLKDLREGKPIVAETKSLCAAVIAQGAKDPSLQRKAQADQAEVDALLEQLGA